MGRSSAGRARLLRASGMWHLRLESARFPDAFRSNVRAQERRKVPSRTITKELYNQMLATFRESPGVWAPVCRATGVGARFARRAWETGWLPRIPWARPIRQVIEDEQQAARAEQFRLEEARRKSLAEEQRAASNDVSKTMAQEGQMISAARVNVLNTLASMLQTGAAVRQLCADFSADVVGGKYKGDPAAAMKALDAYARAQRSLAGVMEKAIQNERLVKGEPTAIVGHSGMPSDMSLEDGFKLVARASDLYALVRARGHIGPGEDPAPEPAPVVLGGPPNGVTH